MPDDEDELADVATYLVGRCEHMLDLAAVTSEAATLASYILAAYDGTAPVVERLRRLLNEPQAHTPETTLN